MAASNIGGYRRKESALQLVRKGNGDEGNQRLRQLAADAEKVKDGTYVIPECPRWVTSKARRFFRLHAQEWWDLGHITQLDSISLGILAESLYTYIQTKNFYRDNDLLPVTKGSYGNHIVSPALKAMQSAQRDLLVLCKEFGLTPFMRNKIDRIVHGRNTSNDYLFND